MEKCSESIGINLVFFFFDKFLIKCHPQITDSLFAIRIFLLSFINAIVGSRPENPGIAEMHISVLFLRSTLLKESKILILLFFDQPKNLSLFNSD